jgi:thiol:disulfide interchange protein DsbA
MIKRVFLSLSLLLLMPLLACAEDAAPAPSFIAGEHYDVISPAVRTADRNTIEVAEFFWYGCGHCYTFEPMLEQWRKTLPEDVSFRGSPAIWNPKMEIHARAFYSAEALGVLDTMHPVIFQAMNVDRKPLSTQAEIAELFAANGVPAEKLDGVFNSFGVNSQVSKAASRVRSAKITGTPALMVNGKYHVGARKAGGQAQMLKVAEFLIEKERAARAQ